MLATLQQEFQQRYSWIKSLRLHPDDEAAMASSAPSDDDGQAASTPGVGRLRLQIIVDAYHVQRNAALLDELGHWATQRGVSIEPTILTEQESTLLAALGATDDPSPWVLMQAYRQQPDYPNNARRQLARALSELRRILHDLGQEFPTSGLHAWNVGLHLQSLYEHILAWGLAVFGEESAGTPEDWARFIELYRAHHPSLLREECRQYPLQLQAFLSRQRQLSALAPKSYGDNDEEIERLLLPLEFAVKAMRACAQQTLVRPEDVERRITLLWWAIMAGSVLGICGLLGFHFATRPASYAAVSLPADGVPGGIKGTYYKKRFGKKYGSRVDKRLHLRWRRRPMRGVPADYFSVEWKGFFYTGLQGEHKLCSRHDDGVRVYLGKTRIIDDWKSGWARTRCKQVHLQRGWHPLKIQFFEKRKIAEIHLSLQRPGDKKPQILKSKHLCCRDKGSARARKRRKAKRRRRRTARARKRRKAKHAKFVR